KNSSLKASPNPDRASAPSSIRMVAMYRFLHIGFAFPGAIKMRDLEPAMTTIGDWVRYSALSWIVWTDKPASQVFQILRWHLDANDQVYIVKLDTLDSYGSLSPWIWTWMNSKTRTIATGPSLEHLMALAKPKT